MIRFDSLGFTRNPMIVECANLLKVTFIRTQTLYRIILKSLYEKNKFKMDLLFNMTLEKVYKKFLFMSTSFHL